MKALEGAGGLKQQSPLCLMRKLSDILDRFCGVLIVAMLGLMVIFTVAQIVCRTWFTSLSWSEEATRFLLIWSTFLGATCVYRHNGNIAITLVQGLFPEQARRGLRTGVHAVCLVLFCLLFYYGMLYCGRQVRTAAAIPIQMKYIYMCLPISMIIMAIHAAVMLVETWKGEER
ncbi:MAG: TRAP transporter small permease [Fretibacterium sp.]|nr:TRAP transporter small permease [Fretibacterium sp.]